MKRSSRGKTGEGLVASVYESHVSKQHANYLPSSSNTNTPSPAGVVKPPEAVHEWERSGYDPWSSGKVPYSTSMVPSLNFEESPPTPTKGRTLKTYSVTDDSKINAVRVRNNKEAADLNRVLSCARHSKLKEIEATYLSEGCTLDIGAQDSSGQTLLIVACQNGNKKIAKFCLRRGANVNQANLAGNTPLHYCFAYGFEKLGNYLISKGANDAKQNADGLTCYEGLSRQSVDLL